MKEYNINLIWYPDFTIKRSNCNLNLNKDFWLYIFTPDSVKRLIDYDKLKLSKRNDLKYILSNLSLSYKLLNIIIKKDIWVSNLIFCFNIISSYLKIINSFSYGIEIKFYNYIQIKDIVYEKPEETIFYKFLLDKYKDFFINIKDWDSINISLEFSDQIFQVYLIEYILKKHYNKEITFNIFLWRLLEFEHKDSIRKRIKNRFINVEFPDKTSTYRSNIVFWEEYNGFLLFNKWCHWRKCIFCNIWKLSKDYKLNKNERVDFVINRIKERKLKFIGITDPSISVKELLYFCNKVIEENLDIRIHLRTRFSEEFTEENCKIFWKAWVRFMWIWLESASPKLNRVINKYNKDYTVDDFNKLLWVCEKSWIKLHYYIIFWIPTETREEIDLTYDFLSKNIYKYSFFSYTAWKLWFNKWTDIYRNYKKYGISFDEKEKWQEIFIDNYKEKNYDENITYIREKINLLKEKLFFWRIKSNIDISGFWFFVENSKMFHVLKMKYDKNPFHDIFNKNSEITSSNLLKYKYKKNPYLQYTKIWRDLYIKNWITLVNIKINKDLLSLLKKYNSEIILEQNIVNNTWKDKTNNIEKYIKELIEGYFLIKI